MEAIRGRLCRDVTGFSVSSAGSVGEFADVGLKFDVSRVAQWIVQAVRDRYMLPFFYCFSKI